MFEEKNLRTAHFRLTSAGLSVNMLYNVPWTFDSITEFWTSYLNFICNCHSLFYCAESPWDNKWMYSSCAAVSATASSAFSSQLKLATQVRDHIFKMNHLLKGLGHEKEIVWQKWIVLGLKEPLLVGGDHGRMNYKDTKPYMSAFL